MIPAEETPSSSWNLKTATPQSAETLGRLLCGMVNRVTVELIDGFDFSSVLPTPLEVMAIREALEAELVIFSEHATRAARDDGVTPLQVFDVIKQGLPVQKDFPRHQSRVAGISFEGRAGGSRKMRVKVSWSEGYYVVTVRAVKLIKRRKSR